MSPIFHQAIPNDIKPARVLTEPLQVIPEDEELNLNLKLTSSRPRPKRSLCEQQPSKIERPPSPATLSKCRLPAPASHHPACPPFTTVHQLGPATTHVYASWNPLSSVSKPSQPSESDLLFGTAAAAFGKKSEMPDSSVQRCRRILMEDFKRTFPDGKVPDSLTLPKEECTYAP